MPTTASTNRAVAPAAALALVLAAAAGSTACSNIPPGRSAVDSVRVLHAHELSADDVQDRLATRASPKFLFLFQGVAFDYSVYDESVLQRDMARVERFYRSRGFFDAHARVARVIHVEPDHVRIQIIVDEGRPVMNRRIVVLGVAGLPPEIVEAVRAAAHRALPQGERFDEEGFAGSEDAVKTALTDRGYAWARVDAQAEVDVGLHTADYGIAVDPGPPAVFGPITIEGLDPDGPNGPRRREIPEDPIRRAIDIDPGEPYSTAKITSAKQALLDLGVFSSVRVVPSLPNPPPADRVVPLTVLTEPTRLRQITLGAGVEIDEIKTDVHAVVGWEDHNFLGGLRSFRVRVKPGVVLYPSSLDNWQGPRLLLPEAWLRTELRQPGFIEARTNAFLRPELNVFPLLVEANPPADAPVVGYREVRAPIGLDRTIFGRVLFVSLDYTFQIENPFTYVGSLDPAVETLFLSFPELRTSLDFRDSVVHPHEGIYLGNTLQVAGGIFGGTASDVREQPEVRTYLPISRGVTFATRASVGFLWPTSYGSDWNGQLEGSDVTAGPPLAGSTPAEIADHDRARRALAHDAQIMYFRGFFSGGPMTNRGFPPLGVSPHGVIPFLSPATARRQVQFGCNPNTPGFDPTQCFLPVGGLTLWELQNEVRFDVSGPLSAAVFCDMSDVSPYENDLRFDHLHLSCGAGAAYDTPVGPVRLDVGYRIQPLQVLGYPNERAAADADPVSGIPPTILGVPIAIAIGIGQAY
jgi:outer membrane protein insertion porin family/translocation and assembly module TamA